MRPVSRLRRAVSTIATAGLVLGGIYLGANPASAAPSEQTLLTLTPAATTVEAGTHTTIAVDVQMCNFDETNSCVAPQGFGILGSATSNGSYLQVQRSPGGSWTRLTIKAAADGSSPATYSFDTGDLTSTTTFTFRMGLEDVGGVYWYGAPVAGDGGIRLLGASADTTITVAVAPTINTGALALGTMRVGAPVNQNLDWADYITGTDTSNVTFASLSGLPEGVEAVPGDGTNIVISGTPTTSGTGTAHLNLRNGADAVPGSNNVTWTVDEGSPSADFCDLNPNDVSCGGTGDDTQPPADSFDLSTLDLGTMTVGTYYYDSFDLGQYITGTASTWHISTVVGLPEGVSADPSGLQLDLAGTPTTAGSDSATVTLSDGQDFLVGNVSWTVGAASFTPGEVTTPPARSWNLAQDIGAFSVRAELYTSGFDWSDGGKITVTGLPKGMTFVRENDGFGPGGLWSDEGQAPTGSVIGASAISGTGTFDVSYTDKFETQTVTVEYTVADNDTLNTNATNFTWRDDTGISWDAWGTAALTKAVLFLDGSPVAAYPLSGSSRDSRTIPAADFRDFSNVYAPNSFTVRTYYAIQLDGETMPTLETPYSAEASFNRGAEPISIGSSTINVHQGDAGVDFTYNGPAGDLIVAYVDGVAVDTFTKNDGDTWHVDFAAYGRADRPHFLSMQVFDLAPDATAPDYNPDSALATRDVSFIPDSVIKDITLDSLQVGARFSQTIDLAEHTTGFWWDAGGGAYLGNMPSGLTYEVLNAATPNGAWSVNGEAPVIRIYGTPLIAGDYQIGIAVEDPHWGTTESDITGTIAAEAVPSLGATSTDLSRNDSTTLTYGGPDGSMLCAEITYTTDLVYCSPIDHGQKVTYDYNALMLYYANNNWDLYPWTEQQTVQLRVWTPAAMAAKGVNLDFWPTANVEPSNSISVTLEPSADATFTPDFVLPQWHVGDDVNLDFDMSEYTTGFDWSRYGDIELDVEQLPAGLDWEYEYGPSGAPILYIWGSPTEAGSGSVSIEVYDGFWGDAVADVPWNVAANGISLSPADLLVTFGDSGFFNYTGPTNRAVAFFNSAHEVVKVGDESLLQDIPWGLMGRDTEVSMTVRVYPFEPGTETPTWSTEAAAQSTVTFAANTPEVKAIDFGPLQVGVGYDKTFDMAEYATGFDWTINGGRVTIDHLPDGLQYKVTNAVNGDWTASGIAPIVHIFGTPTAAGGYESTVTVFDSVYGESGQSASTYPGGSVAMPISLSPATVDITFNKGLDVTYVGPGDRLAALFDGKDLVTWDRADTIASDINYGMLATHLGGATADHEFQLMVFDMAAPGTFPDEYGAPVATTAVNFKSHLASVKAFDFGRIQVGVPYDKSFDLADYGVGFDWSANGGVASVADLPTGLQFEVTNAVNGDLTASGVAPIVRIFGTPTVSTEFSAHVTATDASFPELGQTGAGTSDGTVVPAASLTVLPVGAMTEGTAFTQTFDMATYSANFDWAQGGAVVVSELPAGLSSEITNPLAKAPVVSSHGQAPQLRIFGTPTVHGAFNVTVTLTDQFGASATVDVPLAIATGQVPSDPAPRVTVAGGTATFTIPGLADGAVLTPGTKAPGVLSVSVVEGDVVVRVSSAFSGLVSQPVTVTQDGVDTVVHLVIKVYPTATKSNTFTLKSGNTYVHWTASPSAHLYKVIVNGHVDCTTTVKTTSCTVKGLLGPKAAITVVTVGGNNFTARANAKYVKASVSAPFGAVLFAADSSKLTTASKLTLHNYAVAITRQGFTTVTVAGYIAHWPSNTSATDKAHGIALSKARAAVVRADLAAEFKKLGVKVSVQTLGNGGSHPTVSNALSTSAAGNRRADISVS